MIAAASEVQAVLDAFRHIVQALRLGAEGGRAAGISGAQLFALQQIANNPEASVNDIAALTFTHQSSVSVVIRRLAEAGLVSKTPAKDDRRRATLTVTGKGRRALTRVPGTVQQELVAAIAGLPVADRRMLARVMKTIASRIKPAGKAGPPPMFFEAR